jgi:hypothetical protein
MWSLGRGQVLGRRSLLRFEGAHALSPGLRRPGRTLRGPVPPRASRVPRHPSVTLLENCKASTSIFVLPSYEEPTVNALASTTDEGRVRLR